MISDGYMYRVVMGLMPGGMWAVSENHMPRSYIYAAVVSYEGCVYIAGMCLSFDGYTR